MLGTLEMPPYSLNHDGIVFVALVLVFVTQTTTQWTEKECGAGSFGQR